MAPRIQIHKRYQVLRRNHKAYVICNTSDRSNSNHADANFLGTGLALCGVLPDNYTEKQWNQLMKLKSTPAL